MYKVLAKVLANRLKLVIGIIILDRQYAFVKSWKILDGTLISNEVAEDTKKTKKDLIMFKVGFKKAHDSI